MARRAGARRVDPRVARLPGFEVGETRPAEPAAPPPPPAKSGSDAHPERPKEEARPSRRAPEIAEGPGLEERQARWLKERQRFEARGPPPS